MKKIVLLFLLVSGAVMAVPAQNNAKINAALKRFPGIDRGDAEALVAATRVTAIPLPTWLPQGFKLERLKERIGRGVALEDRELIIIYSRKLQNGKFQRFSLEAGFEGLGGLPYDVTKVIPSAVGKIDLMYEPKDLDDGGKRLRNYVYTEWFMVGKTNFHYNGMYSETENDRSLAMISLAETEKILRSLQKL